MLGCHFKLTTFLKIKVTIKIMRYKREIETQKDRLILGSNLRVTSSSVCLCVWSVHFFISKGCQHRIPASLFKPDLPGMVENQNRFSLLFLSFVVLVGSTSHLSLSRLPMTVSDTQKATNFFFHARKKHFRSKTSSIQSWDNEEKKSLWTSKRSRRDVEALEGDDRDDCDGQERQNRICSWTSETWKSFIESFFLSEARVPSEVCSRHPWALPSSIT